MGFKKYIIVALLFFSVMTTASSAVIYSHNSKKKTTYDKSTKIVNNVLKLAISNAFQPYQFNSLTTFDNRELEKYTFSPMTVLNYDHLDSLVQSSLIEDSAFKKNAEHPDNIKTLNTSWLTRNACDDLIYEKMSFEKIYPYFEASTLYFNEPDAYFLKSLVRYQTLDILIDNKKKPLSKPEPAPVAFLGASIIGLATLQHRHKNKND